MKYDMKVENHDFSVEFSQFPAFSETAEITVSGEIIPVSITRDFSSIIIDGQSYRIGSFCTVDGKIVSVEIDGLKFFIDFGQENRKPDPVNQSRISSPLQGIISAVNVKEGQNIRENQILLTIEAMKMQNEIRAVSSGRVKSVRVKPGDRVKEKELLIELF